MTGWLTHIRNFTPVYYVYTWIGGLFCLNKLKKTDKLILFLGYPRSGSSTLASILDAHKNILISHELNLLKFIKAGFKLHQLFFLIQKNSGISAGRKRISAGYYNLIENQYNGIAEPCRVIGDKKAGGTTLLLSKDRELLTRLTDKYPITLKLIHLCRNPYDMIATQSYGGNNRRYIPTPTSIENAMNLCFSKFEIIHSIKNTHRYDILDIRYEMLIDNPKKELKRIFAWLDLPFDTEYQNAVVKHLFKKPHKSRTEIPWSKSQKEKIRNTIEKYPFLSNYTFES